MRQERIIGKNCRLLMQKQAVSEEEFAKKLGYSVLDVKKLMDGRIFTTHRDIQDIASFFKVLPEFILKDHGKAAYNGSGFMYCMTDFSDEDNEEKILDIFDMYCDLKEMLS